MRLVPGLLVKLYSFKFGLISENSDELMPKLCNSPPIMLSYDPPVKSPSKPPSISFSEESVSSALSEPSLEYFSSVSLELLEPSLEYFSVFPP